MRKLRPNEAQQRISSLQLKRALENFKAWHDKDASKVHEQDYDFPSFVYSCARVVEMIYESDKWEDDGDMYPYIHDFESRPWLYAPEDFEVLDPSNTHRSVRALLCVSNLDGPVPLTLLAVVNEITVEFSGGERQRYYFKNPPILAGTTDNQTLVMFHDDGPLFINGGKMRITPRGIVK